MFLVAPLNAHAEVAVVVPDDQATNDDVDLSLRHEQAIAKSMAQ